MKVNLKNNFKKIFEIFIRANLILYAFIAAYFTQIGGTRAENLPVMKGEYLKQEVKSTTKAAPIVKKEESVSIEKPGKNRFPWGQCTWYVATKRNVTWSGNAKNWYANAQRAGRSVGKIPKAGSIVVLRSGYYGHVGYVESVSGDVITYSEMNIIGLGRISRQTVNIHSIPLIGFIY